MRPAVALFSVLLLPWMFVWQFMQPRATVPSAELLVVRPVGSWPAWLGWLVWLWHSWHRNGGRDFNRLAMVVPCGWWQIAQSSCTGGWLCTNGPRFSMWQVKQVSFTLSRTSCFGLDRKSTRLNSSHGYISYA